MTDVSSSKLTNSINWPVTLVGELCSSYGVSPNQYEFYCHDRAMIASRFPVVPGNPYFVTVGNRHKGIVISCRYKNYSVEGQFHRYPTNRGVWLYTDRSNRGAIATEEWYKFLLHFGIKVGEMHDPIPVYMDFCQDKTVIIRLR